MWGHFWIRITRDQNCHMYRSHHSVGYWACVFGAYILSWPLPACLPPDWHGRALLPWFIPHLRPEQFEPGHASKPGAKISLSSGWFCYSRKEVKWPVAPFAARHYPAGSKRHNTRLQLLCGTEDSYVSKCANFSKRSVNRGVFAESSPTLAIICMECLE